MTSEPDAGPELQGQTPPPEIRGQENPPPEEPRRVGVFSDVHGNKHALLAVLDALEADGIDDVYCCGDVVGYGPFPNECCEILRERNIPTIAGNHDHGALGLTPIENFNETATEAIHWTTSHLSPENEEYLRQLPLVIENGQCFYVHASPNEPDQWNYILTMREARLNFARFSQRVCFIGHSHQPFVVLMTEGGLTCPTGEHIPLPDNSRALVNVGSVGQPRDRNEKACYVVYDPADNALDIKRVPYDIEATRSAIRTNDLPPELGDRLAHGW